jgi:hypothetical protein
MPQGPKSSPDDVQSTAKVAVPLPATELAQHVRAAVTHLNTLSGDTRYAASLNSLKQNAAEAAPVIAQLYRATPETAYVERWSLVKVLADLHHPQSLSHLDAIANTPLPAAQGEGADRTLCEETMIRTTAAEGIARQAGTGDAGALALLLKNCLNPIFSVRQASVQAYLAHGGPQARATLERLIPRNEHFVLDIREVSAADMPQSQPGAVKRTSKAPEVPTPPVQGAGAARPPAGDAPVRK